MADRSDKAVSVRPVEQGMIARAVAGARYMLTGKIDFFGPNVPIAPQAQDLTEGRQLDYPAGYNLQTQPRAGEPISFPVLRALADAHDLTRLAIETRKDQMDKLPWTIKRKDGKPIFGKDGTVTDQKGADLIDFLRKPDKEHRWKSWLRMLLEDLFVIDAPTIYPRKTLGGGIYALEPMDGATIKRVISADGRTPVAPDPAYQQILKGIPAANYTRDELIYAPRNVRTHRFYGFSPVEQIIMIVNIALRREVHQLNYYTEGNIPEMLLSVPQTWTADQISRFQVAWDALMADQAVKRQIKFVPDGMHNIPLKDEKIFDEGDEWLARVVCYAFSLPPTAFVKQVNRATAGSAQEIALEEGLAPIMGWTKDTMDGILEDHLDAKDYEFAWEDVKDVDPLVQAQIDQIYVNAGVDTPDEVREGRGKPPLPDGQGAKIKQPAPAFGAADPNADPAAAGDGKSGAAPKSAKGNKDGVTAAAAEKVAKSAAGRSQRPAHRY